MTRARRKLTVIEGGHQDVPERPVDLPAPPADLPAAMTDEWFTVLRDLADRDVLTDAVVAVVRTYIMALWTAAEAERAIAQHGVMVPGAGGALKPSPATGLLRASRETVARLAGDLGLSRRKASGPKTAPPAASKKWDL